MLKKQIVEGVIYLNVTEARLDAASVPRFKDAFTQAIKGAPELRIALDLSQLQFMDSSGLGAILSMLKSMGGKGDLVVCGAKGPVVELLKLTRMDRVFALVADKEAAIDKLLL